jgi:hypothetical protein
MCKKQLHRSTAWAAARERKAGFTVDLQLGQSCAPVAREDVCVLGVCGRMGFVFGFV